MDYDPYSGQQVRFIRRLQQRWVTKPEQRPVEYAILLLMLVIFLLVWFA